ncbi:hypothetical protein MIC97_16280 [Aquamicrobium sp. NLF2-7]|uniref:lipopolysaccharide biosynthesis protein n=1 Tax=Aquamicrobium sp. NLF2-7 TaxID=2918753 RepID=UPI001EFBB80B|nr:hypothetical protein [Aquamicrobium sp. NLF2-7]MCG8273057.1 hypothetical protein [Aquamicrobium sp. NLF2-7]
MSFNSRLLNLMLRVTTLVTRFIFIFCLARYLEPSEVGYYGLFTATITYFLYLVGLDFYVHTTREIIRTKAESRGLLLKNQISLSAVLYVITLPVAFLILKFIGWPTNLILWFAPILILEHLNQELYRLLIALSDQIFASILLFVRQGSWAIAAIALMLLDDGSRHLDTVMMLWTGSGIVAVVLGCLKLHWLKMGGWDLPIDVAWIKKGILVSGGFLVATLCLRGVQTIDRYWFEALANIEIVAAYVLFLGMASALMVFLDAGVFSYTYPELIRLAHERDYALIRRRVWQMVFQVVATCAIFAVCSWMMLPYLLDWIGNPFYKAALYLYPWVLAAMMINALGMVPHYALYALGLDRPIIYSHLAALPVFVLATWLVSMSFPMIAVPVGLGACFALVLLWKVVAYWRFQSGPNSLKPSTSSP